MDVEQSRPEFLQGLERSCTALHGEHIISAPSAPGLERIEARFDGDFFEPHRHDTYAIGVTLHGVQGFHYRGQQEYSQPGRIIVLHPDEVHDGSAATEDGLCYRMLYIEPTLVRAGMNDNSASLPFVESPVINDPKFRTDLLSALSSLSDDLDELTVVDVISAVASGLSRHGRLDGKPTGMAPIQRMGVARDYLCENSARAVRSEELERITGLDRYAVSRQFRAVFGTSPHRFLIMRRLDRARQLLVQGSPLAEIAAEVGFADQSHLTRHFKASFGITPGRWARACASQQKVRHKNLPWPSE